ncbi:MAG: hypothetical protein LM578_03585 [Desulfurococcaceae archaeon]|nr:hypothetical protein [Desulfurococcaceae archaeon]
MEHVDLGVILKALVVLTIAVYIGFTVASYRSLPQFIVFENIGWVLLYTLCLLVLVYREEPLPLLAVASFNAGRVSNAIVTSTGDIGRLAIQHLPLLLLLLTLAILAAYTGLRRGP